MIGQHAGAQICAAAECGFPDHRDAVRQLDGQQAFCCGKCIFADLRDRQTVDLRWNFDQRACVIPFHFVDDCMIFVQCIGEAVLCDGLGSKCSEGRSEQRRHCRQLRNGADRSRSCSQNDDGSLVSVLHGLYLPNSPYSFVARIACGCLYYSIIYRRCQ